MTSTHDEHFQAICAYLGSGLGSPAGKTALRGEAIQMVQKAPPSEDMIFAAIFTSNDAGLVGEIKSAHGVHAFRELDPFNTNVRPLWRTSPMSEQDLTQIFGWVVECWQEDFIGDSSDAMLYAVETGLPGAVPLIRNLTKPDLENVTRALADRRGLHRISHSNTSVLCSLVDETKDQSRAWEGFVADALIMQSHYLRGVVLAAKCGVNMTGFASCLTNRHPQYRVFLNSVSSQHGRLETMKSLPSVSDILDMTVPELERLMRYCE